MEKRKCVLVDIDGTIADTSNALKYIDGTIETNNWDTYFRVLDTQKPIKHVIEHIREDVAQNKADIVIMTGRNCTSPAMNSTIRFLEEQFSNFLACGGRLAIFTRPINNHEPSYKMKQEYMKMLQQVYDIVSVYEDEPSILIKYMTFKSLLNKRFYLVQGYNSYQVLTMEELNKLLVETLTPLQVPCPKFQTFTEFCDYFKIEVL